MRTFLFLLSFMICSVVCAQTQQGIVKTRGKMVNGQLVAGKRLSGATVTLSIGNALVSNGQGGFSFNVPAGKSYSLVTAKKNGYTLSDPEYTRRSFSYSAKNPFYVVLEDVNQREADINEATRKVRRTLTAQLQKQEDEIEELKAKNKLTEKEYQRRLKELYDNQSKSEQLVKEMAERYASTDYDQLDEFNQQVQMYIEEGDLQKADSMIRSKGDMDKRIADYHNAVEANRVEREKLEKSEAATTKTYEDISLDLYNKHMIARQQLQWDDAMKFLKQRADLDTTNVGAVWDYAYFCHEQKKFKDSEKYYLICLRVYSNTEDIPDIASIQNNLGNLYSNLQDFTNSEKYLKLALENRELLFAQNPDAYRANLASTQNNLGALYKDLHDYTNSEKYYKLALENRGLLFAQNPNAYRADLAMTQHNLGVLYYDLHDYTNSEKYYKLALENKEHLFAQNPDAYRVDLAGTQNNLGALYKDLQDFTNSEKYYKLALENRELLFAQNPDAYRANLASTQNNLGLLYNNLHDYTNSEKYYKRALENKEHLFAQNPDAYRADLAMTQNNLGILYFDLQDYTNSEKYLKLALENKEHLFAQNPDAYRMKLAMTYWSMMLLYEETENIEQYDQYLECALKLYKELYSSQPSIYKDDVIELQNRKVWRMLLNRNIDEALVLAQETYAMDESDNMSKVYLSECCNAKAYEFAEASDYANAHIYIDKAISMCPDNANFYDSKGEIHLMQGKNTEALEMWKKVLELNPDFLKDYPEGTELSNGLKKLGLIE